MMENEALHNAQAEIKRADHLIFVSLKYTRTVDVIKNIIKRLIATYDYGFMALMENEVNLEFRDKVPKLARIAIDEVMKLDLERPQTEEIFHELTAEEKLTHKERMTNYISFYRLLKRIDKSEFDAVREYRRHVTMTAHLMGGEHIEVSIDIISDYYERTKNFVYFVNKLINGEPDSN